MRRDIKRALNDSERDARASGRRIGQQMGSEAGAAFGREMKVALGGIGVGSLPAVATALTTVAGAIQQVAQTGLVLPGVVATGGAALGTLKLATQGLGDSFKEMWKAAESGDPKDIKKAAEAMKDMEPNAKRAMTAVVGFHDEFKKLQNTARGNVFREVDGDFTRFGNKTLPTLTTGMDKTSRAWNNSIREMLRVGSSSSTQGFLDRIFGNTADAQNRANAAIAPLVNAFGTLASAGSDSVPRLGSAVSDLAVRFNAFATAADADGRLNKWINDGLTGTTHLGRTLLGVGQSFTALTKAAGGGEGLLGALDKGSNALARFLNSADGQAKLSKFFADGREQLKSWEPVLSALPPLFGSLYDASRTWSAAVIPPISQLARLLAENTGLVKTAALAWLAFKTVPAIMGRLGTVFTPINTGLGAVRQQVTTSSAHVRAGMASIVGDFRNLGNAAPHLSAASRAMTALNTNSQTFRRTMNAFIGAPTMLSGAASSLRVLAGAGANGAVGAVTTGIRGLGSAVGGVIGALGGPFSAALVGAGVAFAAISSKNEAASRSLKNYQDAVTNTRRAQVDLNEALMRSRGAYTDDVKSAGVSRIAAMTDELKAASERTGSFLDQFRSAGDHGNWAPIGRMVGSAIPLIGPYISAATDPGETEDQRITKQAEAAKEARKALDELKMGQQSLTDTTYGSQAAFDVLVSKLEAAGGGSRDFAGKMREARTEFLQVQSTAANTAPGVYEMATAMRKLADNTASAADKTNALKTAMDAMNPAVSAFEAESQHTRAIEAAKAQTAEPVDQSKGFGDQLFAANGAASGSNANSVALGEQLKAVRDGTTAMSQSGADMAKALADNEQLFADLAARYGTSVDKIRAAYDAFGGKLADAGGKIGELAKLFQTGAIPTNTAIKVDTPGGDEALATLKALGEKVHADNDKEIHVDAPLGKQTIELLEQLGYKVRTDNDKLIIVRADGLTNLQAQLDQLKNPIEVAVKVKTYDDQLREWVNNLAAGRVTQMPQAPVGPAPPVLPTRAFGAIVAMANGGLRQIRKPQSAGIYAGRGAGTIFAEEATKGEAYIPLAPEKRQRSTAILAEVARRFGITSFESGGISVDELKSFASNIAGNSYNWGGGNGDTFSTDCSGAQSTIANFITGGSGRFATASESSELLKRGFQAGDPPDGVAAYWIGWENGGPGGGHTAGTIVDPDGGNVNVEMGGKKGGGQFGGGAAGASSFPNRAWIALAGGDNGKSTGGRGGGASASQVMSAQASVRRTKAASAAAQKDLDEANAELNSAPNDKKRKAAEKKRDNAQRRLDAAKDRQATAEQRLTEVLDKKSKGTEKSASGDGGVQSFGQSLVSGVLQGIGLDGSLFSNPLEWPNVKSGLALLNWGAGYAKAWAGAGGEDDQTGAAGGGGGALGGALAGVGLPNIAPSTEPKNLQPIGAAGTGTGPPPGPPPGGDTWNISGVDPAQIMPKVQALQWPAFQRNLGAKG
ncbi:hypothetical protein [Mycolicibacterium mucogenicum]|uniref:Tape measure protein n=1 Tax=Mycolicibacterium mucogenicum DSM 44124 TaxID=1226753 RepID=A0A8H2JIT2_MYCMU|nr:hypothetical protein [Mycolicibacterium mucogenicum]KAB7755198.1 hypothetical protein MMUC44124_20650 [Mycolicibacterium mucogenicum DSM 44124]QPG68879.1 hypothetical protein C1S78_026260 [Mycolicibacterium mucogenicum DSM 44124]